MTLEHADACGSGSPEWSRPRLSRRSERRRSVRSVRRTCFPNERAFAFSARGLDERTVEARFVIADGYYLYREKLKFALAPATLGPVALPPGKIKEDEFFGKVETYRNQLVVRLPLGQAATGQSVTVSAESQGCADIGVCYPPQIQKVTVVLPAAGGRPGSDRGRVPGEEVLVQVTLRRSIA